MGKKLEQLIQNQEDCQTPANVRKTSSMGRQLTHPRFSHLLLHGESPKQQKKYFLEQFTCWQDLPAWGSTNEYGIFKRKAGSQPHKAFAVVGEPWMPHCDSVVGSLTQEGLAITNDGLVCSGSCLMSSSLVYLEKEQAASPHITDFLVYRQGLG